MEKLIYLSYCQSYPIDWPKLKQNASALMIRTGQAGFEDTLFRSHYANACAHQIPFGLWHFLQPNMAAQPQIDAFLNIYNSLDYKPKVIALDVEDIRYRDQVTGQIVAIEPPSQGYSHNQIMAWCSAVKAATGGKVGIYTRKNYFEQWTYESAEWYQYWLWIAAWYQYTGQVPPALPWKWPTYKIHQYAGGALGFGGMGSNATCSEYFNGTHEELLAFFEPPWSETPEKPPVADPTIDARLTKLEAWAKTINYQG